MQVVNLDWQEVQARRQQQITVAYFPKSNYPKSGLTIVPKLINNGATFSTQLEGIPVGSLNAEVFDVAVDTVNVVNDVFVFNSIMLSWDKKCLKKQDWTKVRNAPFWVRKIIENLKLFVHDENRGFNVFLTGNSLIINYFRNFGLSRAEHHALKMTSLPRAIANLNETLNVIEKELYKFNRKLITMKSEEAEEYLRLSFPNAKE